MSVYDNAEQFHTAFNLPVNTRPTFATDELRLLRANLILEEVSEVLMELGVSFSLIRDEETLSKHCELRLPATALDMEKLAKELEDLDYVTQGTKVTFGLPERAVADAVHKSNMSKLDDMGKPILRGDGKVLKGPHYATADADIAEVFYVLRKIDPKLDVRRLSLEGFKMVKGQDDAEGH